MLVCLVLLCGGSNLSLSRCVFAKKKIGGGPGVPALVTGCGSLVARCGSVGSAGGTTCSSGSGACDSDFESCCDGIGSVSTVPGTAIVVVPRPASFGMVVDHACAGAVITAGGVVATALSVVPVTVRCMTCDFVVNGFVGC